MRNCILLSKTFWSSISFGLLLSMLSTTADAEVTYALPLSGEELAIGNMLEWSTAEEVNSELFVVQRSTNGIDFFDVQKVDAAGISDEQTAYHFMDLGNNNPKSYYRLKQVDDDGSSSFSQTVIVNKQSQNQFMVMSMSNPEAYKKFEVSIDCSVDGDIAYQLTTLQGEKLVDIEQSVGIGLNMIVFDLANEPEGVYKISIQMGDETENLVIRKVMDEVEKKPNVASKGGGFGG